MTAADDALEAARQLLKQGLLGEASAALARVAPDAAVVERAGAALLAGNIGYERGQYAEAHDAWRRADELFASAGSEGDGARVARDNMALADERLARQQALEARVHEVQLAVGLTLVVALAAVALALRLSGGAGKAAAVPAA